MANLAAFVGGGLLQGAGTGVVDNAKAERDAALKQLELDAAQRRTDTQEAGANQRNAATNATSVQTTDMQQEGANSRTATEQAGALQRTGIEQTGATQRTGMTNATTIQATGMQQEGANSRTAAEQTGANTRLDKTIAGENERAGVGNFSARDASLLQMVLKANTDITGQVNKDGAAAGLSAIGRDDLAKLFSNAPKPAAPAANTSDSWWSRLTGASGKTGPTLDSQKQTTRTILNGGSQPSSGGAAMQSGADQSAAPASATAQQPAAAGKPGGSGTSADPFVAQGQSDIDWFRSNAPSGAVLTVNGKIYRKP